MPRADFQFVRFNESFSDNNPRVTRTFTVEGSPLGSGYLLIQAHDVESDEHSISINGQALPRFDIPKGSGGKWQLWMDLIPAGFLTSGEIASRSRASSGTIIFSSQASRYTGEKLATTVSRVSLHLRDELGGRVAVEGFRSALAADAAVLHAAKGCFGQRPSRVIDVDHSGLQAVLDRQCIAGRRRECVRRQAVRQAVGAADRFLEGFERHARRDRTEGFVGHHLAVVGRIGDHRGFEEVTALADAAAAELDSGAARGGILDEFGHRGQTPTTRRRRGIARRRPPRQRLLPGKLRCKGDRLELA